MFMRACMLYAFVSTQNYECKCVCMWLLWVFSNWESVNGKRTALNRIPQKQYNQISAHMKTCSVYKFELRIVAAILMCTELYKRYIAVLLSSHIFMEFYLKCRWHFEVKRCEWHGENNINTSFRVLIHSIDRFPKECHAIR